MKKICILITVLALSSAVFAERTLISAREVPYKDVSLYGTVELKGSYSRADFLEDLDSLCYILEAGYSGYEDMCGLGFDVSAFKKAVSDEVKGETVQVRDFYNAAYENLLPYIQDGHFQLIYFLTQKELFEKSIVFWSDVYVEKKNDSYSVVKSGVPEIQTGDVYSGSEDNLYFYPSSGKNVYRLGKMSVYTDSIHKEESFEFNGKSVPLKLEADTAVSSTNMKYREIETDRTGYVVLNDFSLPPENDPRRKSAEIIFKKFADSGAKFAKKKNVILDLRGNRGGNSVYAASFLSSLYSGKVTESFYSLYEKAAQWNDSMHKTIEVFSPVTAKAHYDFAVSLGEQTTSYDLEHMKLNPVRETFENTRVKFNMVKGKSRFKGNLIILTDRNDFSAGEFTIYLAKELFGDSVKVLGENTAGMCTYYDVITLALPKSGMGVHTALEKEIKLDELDYWLGEGFGMFPDMWSKGDDLNETIFMLTNDSDMKTKLKEIGNRLM